MTDTPENQTSPAIVYTSDPPDPAPFFALFETTGWNATYRLSADDLARAIKASWTLVCAYDAGRLVGFGRVLCDGAVHAFVLDMIVAPDRQGRGIGSEILHRLVERCLSAGIRDIQLFSAKGKSGFYAKHGFGPRPEDAPAMEIKWRPE